MTWLSSRIGLTRYDADELYKEALKAYGKGQYEEALMKLEQAIELLPRNSEYWAAKGLVYLEDGETENAQEAFEQALSLYPYEMLANYGRGIIAYKDENWDEAIAYFNDAFAADPERAETLYYLALCYHRKGLNRQALAYMQRAHEILESQNDRRRTDANRWIREFEKLVNLLPSGE